MVRVKMTLSQYLLQMQTCSNSVLTMSLLLKPFGLDYHPALQPDDGDSWLLVGVLLEDLGERFSAEHEVDPLDIATAAWDLGYEPACAFLEDGPQLIFHVLRSHQGF